MARLKATIKKRIGGRKYVPKKVYGKGAYYRKPATRRVYGRGAYSTSKPKYSGIGKTIGSKLGGMLGKLGEMAVRSVMGLGSYEDVQMPKNIPEKNVLMNELVRGPPSVHNGSDRTNVIRNKEFICNIVTGAANTFNLQSFSINPGIQSTFPWLSQVAANYQQYEWEGLLFEFRSTSADSLNSTNTALGTVILATDYDATDDVTRTFQNKQMMMNHEFSQSCKQSCSVLHPVECKPTLNPLTVYNVRTGVEPINADTRFCDVGTFCIATDGQQAANITIGELWVTYQVRFLKPQALSLIGGEVLAWKAFNSLGVNTSNYFGTLSALAVRSGSTLGMSATANTLRFPVNLQSGAFLVLYSINGASTASVIPPSITPTNCSVPLVFVNGANGSVQAPVPTATATALVLAFIVIINQPSASLLFTGGTLPSAAQMDVVVTEYNGTIVN